MNMYVSIRRFCPINNQWSISTTLCSFEWKIANRYFTLPCSLVVVDFFFLIWILRLFAAKRRKSQTVTLAPMMSQLASVDSNHNDHFVEIQNIIFCVVYNLHIVPSKYVCAQCWEVPTKRRPQRIKTNINDYVVKRGCWIVAQPRRNNQSNFQ